MPVAASVRGALPRTGDGYSAAKLPVATPPAAT